MRALREAACDSAPNYAPSSGPLAHKARRTGRSVRGGQCAARRIRCDSATASGHAHHATPCAPALNAVRSRLESPAERFTGKDQTRPPSPKLPHKKIWLGIGFRCERCRDLAPPGGQRCDRSGSACSARRKFDPSSTEDTEDNPPDQPKTLMNTGFARPQLQLRTARWQLRTLRATHSVGGRWCPGLYLRRISADNLVRPDRNEAYRTNPRTFPWARHWQPHGGRITRMRNCPRRTHRGVSCWRSLSTLVQSRAKVTRPAACRRTAAARPHSSPSKIEDRMR